EQVTFQGADAPIDDTTRTETLLEVTTPPGAGFAAVQLHYEDGSVLNAGVFSYQCPEGTGLSGDLTECVEAGPGSIGIGGTVPVKLCERGTYQPASRQTSCEETSAGFYAP